MPEVWRITIEAPNGKAAQQWAEAVLRNGGEVIFSEPVPSDSVEIATHFTNKAIKGKTIDLVSRLRAHGITRFDDFEKLNIIEAWRKASQSSLLGCAEFLRICEIMIELGKRFADFDPSGPPLLNGLAWRGAYGLELRTANLLVNRGIVYLHMLKSLDPDEIRELHLFGEKVTDAVLAVRSAF